MSNNNNYATFKDQSIECKLVFIQNVLNQTEIPPFFGQKKKSAVKNIFFRIKNGEESRRHWIFFENECFFCAYCICFAAKNIFVTGVQMNKRTSDYVKKHDDQQYHKLAKNKYLELFSPDQATTQSAKWKILRAVVKVIIFVGTHSRYLCRQ